MTDNTSTDHSPEASKPGSTLTCPVCRQDFDNVQGKGGHLAVMKDAAHEAYRTLGKLPIQEPQLLLPEVAGGPRPSTSEGGEPQAEPDLEPDPQTLDASPRQQEEDPQPEPSRGPQDLAGPLPQALPLDLAALAGLEGEDGPEVFQVRFEPPAEIQPLLPEPSESDAMGGKTSGKRPKVEVPLEPILAGGVAAALNGIVLNKPGDGELSVEMVRTTGFPKAAEACLRHYFPDLDLDHPVVALVASGAALGVLVVSLKAPKDRQGKATSIQENGTSHDGPEVEGADLEDEPSATGDAYWDSILQQAGGGRQ